jgi:membrane protein required for beta-lactamase induction
VLAGGERQAEPAARVVDGSARGVDRLLLILDSWLRSKLPAGDFAPLVGLSVHTLRAWKAKFAELGPARLDDKPCGRPPGSRLSEPASGRS